MLLLCLSLIWLKTIDNASIEQNWDDSACDANRYWPNGNGLCMWHKVNMRRWMMIILYSSIIIRLYTEILEDEWWACDSWAIGIFESELLSQLPHLDANQMAMEAL